MRTIHKNSLAALMTAVLAACSSTPIAPPATTGSTAAAQPAASTSRAMPATPAAATPAPSSGSTVTTVTNAGQAAGASTAVKVPAYLDPKSEISMGRSAYFDFDKAILKPEFVGMVERHGKYLMSNPTLAIRVEGNCDERGSREYNLALGQKRAEAVRQALKLAGVDDKRMEAVSWGEERPKATGHDEAAWAENRRADIQYPGK